MRAKLCNDGNGLFYGIRFDCPGCGIPHVLATDWCPPGREQSPLPRLRWEFNGDLFNPTLAPSILLEWEHGPQREPRRCHSYVREGRIEYLPDCTHRFVGQTIDLPQIV